MTASTPFRKFTSLCLSALFCLSFFTASAAGDYSDDNSQNTIQSHIREGNRADEILPGVSRDGMGVWLKADQGVETDATGKVTKWVDQSGNGFVLTPATENNGPTLVRNDEDTLKGKPFLSFNSSSGLVYKMSEDQKDSLNRMSTTVIIHSKTTSHPSMWKGMFRSYSGTVEDHGPTSNLSTFTIGGNSTNKNLFIDIRKKTTYYDFGRECDEYTPYETHSFRFDSESRKIEYHSRMSRNAFDFSIENGNLRKTADYLSNFSGLYYHRYGIGANTAGSGMQMDIAEVIVFHRTLSDTELNTINTYLSEKYENIQPKIESISPRHIQYEGTEFKMSFKIGRREEAGVAISIYEEGTNNLVESKSETVTSDGEIRINPDLSAGSPRSYYAKGFLWNSIESMEPLVEPVSSIYEPAKIIFDTDMDSDIDDAAALALLHHFADNGEAEILATISSSSHEYSAPVIDVINTYFGRPDIPIGQNKAEAPKKTWILKGGEIANNFPYNTNKENAEDAVQLYRRILSDQPDNSVTIVTVGYLSNLENLLKSDSDQYSNLNGLELVRKKVKNYVCMGSRYPADTDGPGKWGNFRPDPAASQYVAQNWPTIIHFTGGGSFAWECAAGEGLKQTSTDNPVRYAYSLAKGEKNNWLHHSADTISVYIAVRGIEPCFKVVKNGYNEIDDIGRNAWKTDYDNSLHQYSSDFVKNPILQKNFFNYVLSLPPGSTLPVSIEIPVD